MNRSIFISFILVLVFSSCNLFKQNSVNTIALSAVIKNIIAGKDTTHHSLLIFRDKELPPADNPDRIRIDTINESGNKFYIVLAEYRNPVYNRFAIIDPGYNVLLLDESLNGVLKDDFIKTGNVRFIRVEENFISKGIIRLKRQSLYSLNKKSEADLVFRTYTELNMPGISCTQELTKLTPSEITTKISNSSPGVTGLKNGNDLFLFNPDSREYTSNQAVFDSFVVNSVYNSSTNSDDPQITSRKELLNQMGIVPVEEKTEYKNGNFSMPLTNQWDEIKNVKITGIIKKVMTGTKYINNHYGAEITVIRLSPDDSSENYINHPFVNISSGNYRVRFTEKFSQGIYYYQFFEYSCSSEKFLLILQTLKSTYDIYKSDYQNLINSFSIEC